MFSFDAFWYFKILNYVTKRSLVTCLSNIFLTFVINLVTNVSYKVQTAVTTTPRAQTTPKLTIFPFVYIFFTIIIKQNVQFFLCL